MSIAALIAEQVHKLRADRQLPPIEITGNMSMFGEGLGLDSLDMAVLVAVLEQETGHDPFVETVPTLRTFDDFVALYQPKP